MANSVDTTKTMMPKLRQMYKESVVSEIQKEFKLNAMDVPSLEKIVVSVGLGKDKDNKRMFEVANNTLTKVTGQKPIETIAKKSIASFKLREGNRIGLKVTLRGDRMYEFYDRLVNLVMPRLRDFHGLDEKAFDGHGNFNVGLKDQSVFHELSFEEITLSHGLEITIVTSTDSNQLAKSLLSKLGMPFKKEETK